MNLHIIGSFFSAPEVRWPVVSFTQLLIKCVSDHVGFVENKWQWERLCIRLSSWSGAGEMDALVTGVPSGLSRNTSHRFKRSLPLGAVDAGASRCGRSDVASQEIQQAESGWPCLVPGKRQREALRWLAEGGTVRASGRLAGEFRASGTPPSHSTARTLQHPSAFVNLETPTAMKRF
jgi:hypothetical protein